MMLARNIRKGTLVCDRNIWRVAAAVDIQRDRNGYGSVLCTFADHHHMEYPLGAHLDTIHLAAAQTAAVRLAAEGKVYRRRYIGGTWTWRVDGFIPAPRQTVYNKIASYGLIQPVLAQPLGTWERWEATAAGHTVLGHTPARKG